MVDLKRRDKTTNYKRFLCTMSRIAVNLGASQVKESKRLIDLKLLIV